MLVNMVINLYFCQHILLAHLIFQKLYLMEWCMHIHSLPLHTCSLHALLTSFSCALLAALMHAVPSLWPNLTEKLYKPLIIRKYTCKCSVWFCYSLGKSVQPGSINSLTASYSTADFSHCAVRVQHLFLFLRTITAATTVEVHAVKGDTGDLGWIC